MSTTFNIYKIKSSKYDDLLAKLDSIGLKKQLTKVIDNYNLTFYFSDNVKGNEIWWLKTYSEFLNNKDQERFNIFHYGLLLCQKTIDENLIFAISLGKSHFYLNKYIQTNFGIDLAVRMANEKTTLLKKSRFFSGVKRQEVSSYEKFIKDSYEAGESVEHIKLKAEDTELWGTKNIIFADSVQLEIEKSPQDLPKLLEKIEETLAISDLKISLPKIEHAPEEIKQILDSEIIKTLKDPNHTSISIEEFNSNGVNICFRTNDHSYVLRYLQNDRKYISSAEFNSIDGKIISDFIKENTEINDINNLKIQFKNEERGKFTLSIKEVIDSIIELNDENYFLKNGDWYKFNQTFREYLKNSIEKINTMRGEDLDDEKYIEWFTAKSKKINAGEPTIDDITYREYYFNDFLSTKYGYTLLDRELSEIKSLDDRLPDYKLEIADLYNDGEIISLKISDEKMSLIYNIAQSNSSIEAIKRNLVKNDISIHSAALWFVFEKDIEKITDFNSIQFLLEIESWKKNVENHGLTPKIYISKLINKSKTPPLPKRPKVEKTKKLMKL